MAEPNFELLPTELKILILFHVPDIQTLQALIFASPGYHGAYLAVREELLKRVIARQYGDLVDQAEVMIAVRSKGVYYGSRTDDAIALLDIWRRRDEARAIGHEFITRNFTPHGLSETLQLLSFYRIIDFFLQDVLTYAPRPPWMEPGQWNEHLPLTLSLTEKRRLARALCRLQILKNIFEGHVWNELAEICDPSAESYKWDWPTMYEYDPWTDEDEWAGRHRFEYRLFYATFPPWEFDEMGSVFGYLLSRVDVAAQEISDDLRRLAKANNCEFFWDILPVEERPGGADIERVQDLDGFFHRYSRLVGLGPEFLYHALRKDRLSRRKVICDNCTTGHFTFIGSEAFDQCDHRFPFTEPADNLNFPQNFNQSWSKLPPHHQPSEGWKKAWLLPNRNGDTLEESMVTERYTEEDWDWCYAVWDESRLREWKAPLVDPETVPTGNLRRMATGNARRIFYPYIPGPYIYT